jgi:alpha-amylase
MEAAHTVVELSPGRVVTEATASVRARHGDFPVLIRKSIELGGDRLAPALTVRISIRNAGEVPLRARLGIEWAMMMLGGGGNPSAWFDVAGRRTAHDASGNAGNVGAVGQGNDWLGVSASAIPSPAADAWWAPIETISNSEDGFERVYQGSSLLLSWPLDLAPGAVETVAVEQRVTVARDRAAG